MHCKEQRLIIIAAPILYFVADGARDGLDSSSKLRSDYRKLTWRQRPWQKLLLALYLNFTRSTGNARATPEKVA